MSPSFIFVLQMINLWYRFGKGAISDFENKGYEKIFYSSGYGHGFVGSRCNCAESRLGSSEDERECMLYYS